MTQKGTVIVTGGAGGIGEAIVRRLAQEGFPVCINDMEVSRKAAEQLATEIERKNGKGRAIVVCADVTDADQGDQMIDEAVEALGPLNVMIANAGIAHVCPSLELSAKDVQKMTNVNFMGVFNCYTSAARKMISQGPQKTGQLDLLYRILGASSIAAYKPFPMLSHYCATKAAVRVITQTFAAEMARLGIRVNCYAPGIVGTKMWDMVDEKLGAIE